MSVVEEILAKFAAREIENRDEEIITWNFSAHFPAAALRSFISSDLGWEESNSTHSFSSHSSLFMSNIRHRHCRLLFKWICHFLPPSWAHARNFLFSFPIFHCVFISLMRTFSWMAEAALRVGKLKENSSARWWCVRLEEAKKGEKKREEKLNDKGNNIKNTKKKAVKGDRREKKFPI